MQQKKDSFLSTIKQALAHEDCIVVVGFKYVTKTFIKSNSTELFR